MKVKVLSIREVSIDGKRISHRDMMLACHHEDAATASWYRRFVAEEVIPAVKRAEADAHDEYISAPQPVSGGLVAGGHGSMSIGLDAAKQAAYLAWGELARAYQRAVDGRGISTVPLSRSGSPGVRPWEVECAC